MSADQIFCFWPNLLNMDTEANNKFEILKKNAKKKLLKFT